MIGAAAARYRPFSRFAYHYVTGKLSNDPVAKALFDLAGTGTFGDVVDVGCGRGHFAAVLLLAGRARSVIGLDHNARHLAQARLALHGLAFEARLQDFATPQPIPAADTVLLIDVLYQLSTPAQDALLTQAAASARCRLIVRTADPSRGLRSLATRALEQGFRRVWPHAGRHVNARPVAAMAARLAACGLACTIAPCWAGTPFSNILLVAERADRPD